jgi:hypothetical protein
MTRATDTAVIGVFADHGQAQRAYEELLRAGFRDEQIGYLGRNGPPEPDGESVAAHAAEGVAAGAVGGGVVGIAWGLAVAANLIPGIGPVIAGGTIATLLAGSAAAGAAVGGAAGLLIGLGVPAEHAGYYEQQLQAGRSLITVQAGERNGEALAILRRYTVPTETTANRDVLAGTPG